MSYTQILYHIVFRTKNSRRTLPHSVEKKLYNFIWGMVKQRDCMLYRINGMEDHVHLLISLHPTIALSDFMRELKAGASKWLATQPEFPDFDGWNEGYAALTYSKRDIDTIAEYIRNQREHHKCISFAEEYRNIIREMGLEPSPYEKLGDEEEV